MRTRTGRWLIAPIVVALVSLNLFYHVNTMTAASRVNMMRKQKAKQAKRYQSASEELVVLCI